MKVQAQTASTAAKKAKATPVAASQTAKAADTSAKKPAAGEPKDWTVLMYIAGDNDLEPYAAKMMQQVESKCGSTDNVNVVAQLGRMEQSELKKLYGTQGRKYKPTNIDGDWGGIRRYYVTKQEDKGKDAETKIFSKCLQKTDDKAMSNPTTLADFLVWGMKKYPAEHTMVVLCDHGGGFLGAFTSDASASGHSIMKPEDISSAFKIAETATGKKPEVIDMVACLMATSEVAYELKDRAKYFLASEEIGTTASFDYGPVISTITDASAKGKSISPKTLAQTIVHHYDDKPAAFKTKSAIDLEKMEAVKGGLGNLVEKLKNTKVPAQKVADAIGMSQNFGITEQSIYPFYDQIHDLGGLARNLADSKQFPDKAVNKAAKALAESVDAAVVSNLAHDYKRVESRGEGKSVDGKETFTDVRIYQGHYDTHGLSVFAPNTPQAINSKKMPEYAGLDFVKESGWGDYLKDLGKALSAPTAGKPDGKVVSRPENPDLRAAG
jgi:hypothetical protein